MLDKSKLYYVNDRKTDTVHILFEDDISWYVEEVNQRVDSHRNPIRRSCKKTSFSLNKFNNKHIFFAEVIQAKAYEVEGDYAEAHDIFELFLKSDDNMTNSAYYTIGNNVTINRRADLDRSRIIGIAGDL